MNSKIKTGHLIIILCLMLFILNISFLFEIMKLLSAYISFLIGEPGEAVKQFNLTLADHFISLIFLVVITAAGFLNFRKSIFRRKLTFNSAVVIVLGMVFIFAPLIATSNPEFQKDLSVTKLLPPLSSVQVIHLKGSEVPPDEDFFSIRNYVIKSTFNESLIFSDSIRSAGELVYYQKGKEHIIKEEMVEFIDGKPKIESKLYLLGTDQFGRDTFARLVYGARISIFVGIGAVTITMVLGVVFGFIAGYTGGLTDTILSRITDMLLAFPIIFLIILILALFGNSLWTIIIVLGYSGWMSLFKIVRGEVISIKQKEYFISAKLSGLSGKSLLLKEIFPVILAPVIVNLVFQYGNVILAESALSYLGLGTGSLYPSWGGMIESGQEYLTRAWWMIFFPGLALFITLYTANNLGKELNMFFNPRLINDK